MPRPATAHHCQAPPDATWEHRARQHTHRTSQGLSQASADSETSKESTDQRPKIVGNEQVKAKTCIWTNFQKLKPGEASCVIRPFQLPSTRMENTLCICCMVFTRWFWYNLLFNLYHTVAPSSSSRAVSPYMHCIRNILTGKSVGEKPQNTNVRLFFFLLLLNSFSFCSWIIKKKSHPRSCTPLGTLILQDKGRLITCQHFKASWYSLVAQQQQRLLLYSNDSSQVQQEFGINQIPQSWEK